MQAFEQFLEYKLRIPVRGAIMLNEAMDSAVLVKGWKKGANWSFPRGKINKDEDDLICAIREVYEETGYDLEAAGLVPEDRNVKHIDITIRDQDLRLYVFSGVPMDTHFEPKTRKEISKIQWWRISDLPSFHGKKGQQQQAEAAVNANKFYMVAPFIRSVKKWAAEQRNKNSTRATSNQYLSAGLSHDEPLTEEDQGAESNSHDQVYLNPSAPTINQLETALRTALRIQPPTQGLQLEAITAMQSPAKDSGQELLALLQGNSRRSNQAPQSNLPQQTPRDRVFTQAPVPTMPYHQQPRPMVQGQPPISVFPTQLRNDLSNLAPSTARNEPFSGLPPFPEFPAHLRNTLPHLEANHHPSHQPFNTSIFQQGQMQGQRQPEPAPPHPHSHQPQHLVHPQPLPPQVQRAVFTGGPMHAPIAPQLSQQVSALHPNPPASQAVHQPPPNINPVASQKQPPPQLTDHSLALLNAFKSRDKKVENTLVSNDASLRRLAQQGQQAPPQELPAEVSTAPKVDLLSMFKVQQTESSPTISPGTKPPVNEAHRSSLLNLFKGPSRPSVSPAAAAATAFPSSTTPSAVELSAVEPLSSNAVPSSSSVNDGQASYHQERSQAIPELHPNAHLPFRATSILARPAQGNGSSRRGGNVPTHETPSSGASAAAIPSRRTPSSKPAPEKPFQPQILKRPQPAATKPVEPPKPAPSPRAALPVEQPSFDRRGSQTAEHKQALLSLFSKPPSPPAPLIPNLTGGSFAPLPTAGPANPPQVKTRVGSLVSEDPSRRGSQQPALSPADKSFLLSYLDNVAKGTHL